MDKIRILRAQVRWNIGWDNTPDLELLADQLPKGDDWVYEAKVIDDNNTFYFAEVDGVCTFMLSNKKDRTGAMGINSGLKRSPCIIDGDGWCSKHDRHPNECGRVGEGLVRFSVGGCWSSNAGYSNSLGFTECTEAHWAMRPEAMDVGHTFLWGYYISIKKLQEEVWPILDHKGGEARLVRTGPRVYILPAKGSCKRCKGTKLDKYPQGSPCVRCQGTGKSGELHMHPCSSCAGAWACECYHPNDTRYCCYPCEKGKQKETEDGVVPDHNKFSCLVAAEPTEPYIDPQISQEQMLW